MDSSYPPPPRQLPATSESSGIQFSRDADYLIQSFLPMPEPQGAPPAYNPRAVIGIPLPFCTPQIATSFDSSFARGYNPELQTCVGISQQQLLDFIDGLNLAMAASPPLRVVDFAGKIIGFIPYHWAMIAGAIMQTAAQTGMHVLSKTLTDRYLRAANLRLFKPKGLSVRLCSSAAMQHLVMRKGTGAGPSALDKIGRGVGTVLLHAPLPFSSRIVRSIAEKPPKVPASISAVGDGIKMPLATQRRLATLHGYALPLQLDVPPPAKAQGVMDTMGSWGVSFDAWRTRRKQTRVEQRRRELARIEEQLQRMGFTPQGGHTPGPMGGLPIGAYGGPPQMGGAPHGYGGPPQMGGPFAGQPQMVASPYGYAGQPQMAGSPYGYAGQPQMGGGLYDHTTPQGYFFMGRRERNEMRKAARREGKQLRKAARHARRRERGGGLISSLIGPKETKLERRVANADLLEHWESDQVLYCVIMNAELDKEIEGIERAESMENEEHVDQNTWRSEILKERDALEEELDSDDSDESDDEDSHHKH